MADEPEQLVMNVTASFVSEVGYGYVYRCNVVGIVAGVLEQKEFNLTILAGDQEKLAFMSGRPANTVFEIGCNKKNTNEPYSLMPISGFVDDNRTSWEIEYLKQT